jgi:hypothetical protein
VKGHYVIWLKIIMSMLITRRTPISLTHGGFCTFQPQNKLNNDRIKNNGRNRLHMKVAKKLERIQCAVRHACCPSTTSNRHQRTISRNMGTQICNITTGPHTEIDSVGGDMEEEEGRRRKKAPK